MWPDQDEARYILSLLTLFPQVIAVQQHYVRPAPTELSETVLTDDCKLETGLQEENIKNAHPLDHVLEEVTIPTHISFIITIARSFRPGQKQRGYSFRRWL